MIDKTGKDIDIQATIEEPQLYIQGQSRSTVEDQMKFVPTRQEDLRDLRNPVLTNCGIEVCDIMRFMNGAIQQLSWRMAPNMEETMDVQVVMETSTQAMT